MRVLIIVFVMVLFVYQDCCSQSRVRLQISCSDLVDFFVIDPLGRKTGRDPRSKQIGEATQWNQDPQAAYHMETAGDGAPDYMEFEKILTSSAEAGVYSIRIISSELGTFNFHILAGPYLTQTLIHKYYYSYKRIPVDKDSTIDYRFEYHFEPESNVGIIKVVSARSLAQDVAVMTKLSWITSQTASNEYRDLINDASKGLESSYYLDALSSFVKLKIRVAADTTNPKARDVYRILYPDIEQLLTQLPTAAQMLDSLVEFVDRSLEKNWLGNRGFAVELKNGINNAQKHLQNADSLNCSKEIIQVQSKVRKVYEKESPSNESRYVTDQGYKLLVENAQYVVDRLPAAGKEQNFQEKK